MIINPLSFALALGGITFILTVIWGGPLVEILRRLRIGTKIRADGPQWHEAKQGTPTMGGLLIVVPVTLITLALNFVNLIRPSASERVTGVSILLPLFMLVGFGLLGGIDDWLKLRTHGEGLSVRTKAISQIGLAAAAAIFMSLGGFQFANELYLPVIGIALPLSPLLYIPFATFIIFAASNSVNLADGLDGLAGTVTSSAFLAYGLVALQQQQIYLVQFAFIMIGACFAFLWYNAVPAQLIMGDLGALAIGAALGTIALMTRHWLLLPIIAIVPVAEAISVVLQVLYARWSGGKKLFKRSPLHFHFELEGWSESQVVQRFWLVSILSSMIGVALALIGSNISQ
jgi:phospho-N-acetylmuramoyl-pentapeptide-transferase